MITRQYSLDGELISVDDDVPLPKNFTGINEIVDTGARFWRVNGKRHRDNDLPASEYGDGTKYWFIDGKCHRLNGPAVIDSFDNKKYFLYGIEYTEIQHKLFIDLMKLKGLI